MSLNVYMDGAERARKRPGPVAMSVLIHIAAFLALMGAPEIKLPAESKSAYKQAIEGHEDKLVWFRFNKDLPDVTPPKAKAERRPLRAQVKASQQIVASRKDAPKQKQMVWTDAPELRETKVVEMPNVLAIRIPQIARPFVPPPEPAKPDLAKVVLPADAPQLQPQAVEPVKLADAPKIAKPFVAPPQRVPVKIADVAPPPDAPQLEARADAPSLNYSFKTPARPFTAPPSKAAPRYPSLP